MGFLDKIRGKTDETSFKFLDQLVQSNRTIVLSNDIILKSNEEDKYKDGIIVDGRDFVLDGNGHSIDAGGKTRVFKIISGNITLKNVKIKNSFGTAFINQKGNVLLQNCSFSDNSCKVEGGALGNGYGSITIENCDFSNNRADRGGSILNAGKMHIKNSVLKENVSDRNAGAINSFEGELKIENSKIISNRAGEGGIIYNGSKSRLTLTDCEIVNNDGGAIVNFGQSMIKNVTMKENRVILVGGAIHNSQGGIMDVSDCTFIKNEASEGGGAIGNNGKLTLEKSTLKENKAGVGGAIANNTNGILTLKDNVIEDNIAKQHGGGIWTAYKDKVEEVSCKFNNNRPDDFYSPRG